LARDRYSPQRIWRINHEQVKTMLEPASNERADNSLPIKSRVQTWIGIADDIAEE